MSTGTRLFITQKKKEREESFPRKTFSPWNAKKAPTLRSEKSPMGFERKEPKKDLTSGERHPMYKGKKRPFVRGRGTKKSIPKRGGFLGSRRGKETPEFPKREFLGGGEKKKNHQEESQGTRDQAEKELVCSEKKRPLRHLGNPGKKN